jgi:chromosome segregation ATPase
VGDQRAKDLLALAYTLEQRDAEVAAQLDLVVGLLRQVDESRARAAEVRSALSAVPEAMQLAEQTLHDAEARAAEAEREVAEAERGLEAARRSRRAGEEAVTAAERAVSRATVAARDARGAVSRTEEHLQALARDEIALRADAGSVLAGARDTAAAVAGVPRLSDAGRALPGDTLEEVEEWGSRVHASLFVVRGSLENERERFVLEANTLAAAMLGDYDGAASVALVRKRLEQALA